MFAVMSNKNSCALTLHVTSAVNACVVLHETQSCTLVILEKYLHFIHDDILMVFMVYVQRSD